MMNWTTLPLYPVGATGILGLTVLMLFRGVLIPRKTYEDRMRDKDDQLDYYREALDREVQRNAELAGQVDMLMEVATTAEHILRSLPIAAGLTGGTDELAS